MSKIGGLRALLKKLIGDSPKRLNEDALRMGDPNYTPIETWESFLNEQNMVPRGLNLSSYVNKASLQEPSPSRALRSQRGSDLNLGISATPGWMGTHFDMAGGPQALDILAHAKRQPTLLDDPHLVEASIDPRARMLVVNDEIVNDPGHIYWAKLLEQDKIFNDERVLQEALKKKGIQGLIYNNTYEGIKSRSWPYSRLHEGKPADLDGLLWQFGNPGISVLDPNIMNIDSISRKKGGLAKVNNYAGGGLVRGALARIARHMNPAEPAIRRETNIIKERGGNWMDEDLSDALDDPDLATVMPEYNTIPFVVDDVLDMNNLRPGGLMKGDLVGDWGHKTFNKYIRNDLATENDKIRQFIDQGLYMPSGNWTPSEVFNEINDGRRKAPREGTDWPQLATTPEGKAWEDLMDMSVTSASMKELREGKDFTDAGSHWSDKLKDDDKVHMLQDHEDGFTFGPLNHTMRHVTDVVREMFNEGQISPEQLKQLSLEKALRITNDYDIRMEAARIKDQERNMALAGSQGRLMKEYPDSGLKWVNLERPQSLDEVSAAQIKPTSYGKFQAFDLEGKPIYNQATETFAIGDTPEDAYLAGQLITEGNIMGHCVGGYCPQVLKGKTQIVSLRDAKGEPHVTLELSSDPLQAVQSLPRVRSDRIWKEAEKLAENQQGSGLTSRDFLTEAYTTVVGTPPSLGVVQIKGKGNKAPVDAYIPAVQDLIREQGWRIDGDKANSRLFERGSVFNPVELKRLTEMNMEPKTYVNMDEIQSLRKALGSPWRPIDDRPELDLDGFKEGGLVDWEKFTREWMK